MRILFYYINLHISFKDIISNLIFESKVNRVTLLKYILLLKEVSLFIFLVGIILPLKISSEIL